METQAKKFVDLGLPLGAYREEVYCVCPSCSDPALIQGSAKYADPYWATEARAQCLNCSFSRDLALNENWFGPVIGQAQQPCPNCGHQWLEAQVREEKLALHTRKTAVVECNVCHQKSEMVLNWHKDKYHDQPHDPYFGLPLWLQSECCGNTFWAYNQEHLQALKSYIAAKLREQRRRGKWSMSTRLPQWIKSAKNRDALIKCINKLEEKLEAIGK
jgi:hypothetical protein